MDAGLFGVVKRVEATVSVSEHRRTKLHFRGVSLLIALMLMILVSPLFEGSVIGSFVTTGLYSVVILSIVYAMSARRRIRLTGFAWALVAIALLWVDISDPTDPSHIAGLIMFIGLNTAAIILVFRRIFQDREVSFDTICHSVALYLLLGVTWALIYLVANLAITESFAELAPSSDSGWSDFLYFSFATLTTLGYGDITPDLPFIKVWAVMEAVVGVLYIAILVARLVSLYHK